jgi:hypothetical protein
MTNKMLDPFREPQWEEIVGFMVYPSPDASVTLSTTVVKIDKERPGNLPLSDPFRMGIVHEVMRVTDSKILGHLHVGILPSKVPYFAVYNAKGRAVADCYSLIDALSWLITE